jgi:hypothetical protein
VPPSIFDQDSPEPILRNWRRVAHCNSTGLDQQSQQKEAATPLIHSQKTEEMKI